MLCQGLKSNRKIKRAIIAATLAVLVFVFGASVVFASAGWITGKFGKTYDFNGEMYFDAGSVYNGVKTIAFWVKNADTAAGAVVDLNGSDYVSIISGAISATGFTATIYVDGVAGSTISDSNWHYVVLTTTEAQNASAVKFGSIENGNLTGPLDDVKFYNYALSTREINEKYRGGGGGSAPSIAQGGTIDGNLYIMNSGSVGIGTIVPGKALEVNSATGANLRLTYDDSDGTATYYTDFSISASGDLTLDAVGGNLILADEDTIAIGGAAGTAYNVIGDATTGMSHSLASDDDLYIEGDLEVDGSAYFDGSVTVAGSFSAANITTVSGLTASRLVATDASKNLVSSDLNSWVTGTSNQITVTDDADGTITLSLPQDIHTAASPTFAGLELSSATASPTLTITNASDTDTYDPTIAFRTGASPAIRQSIWLDDSDSDKLKFGLTGATYPALTIGTDGYFLSQIPDNSTTAFEIREATNSYLTFDTTDDSEKIVVGKDLEVGLMKIDANSGAVNFVDMDITGTDPAGTVQSLSVALDGNVVATFYGEADGAGVLQNPRFGIGITTPAYDLDVLKTSTSGTTYVANFFNDGNAAGYYGLRVQAGADDASGTTYYLDAYDGDGGSVGYLANVDGTFGVTDISDIRTKTNIENTGLSGLNIVNGLRVVDFNRLQNPDGPTLHGFIAQEAQTVFPEMVSEGPDGLLGLRQDLLIPVLVKAVQEQSAGIEEGFSLRDLKIEGLESGIGNQESGIANLEARIGDLESGIRNQESRIGDLENEITVADGSGEQADLASLQGTLQTLVDSLSNLENVSSELDNLGASILTVMENNQANTARIDELEEEMQNLNQIVKIVEDAVVIGDLNKFIVLDSASGLEIKAANFSLDREGNVIASGEIKTKIGRISSETGILELNPGEASEEEPEPRVVVQGDLEIQGKIILGTKDSASDEEDEDSEELMADPTTGKAKIAPGETAIVIANDNITENSLIYITPTSKTFGQVLYLESQRAEDEENPDDPEETLPRGFSVAIENAASGEVEFNWWIVDSE